MTRTMGDATHDAVPVLAAASFLDMVAGYATGTADIRWTAADTALFTGRGIPVLMIDQGGLGAPVYSANVIDVETYANPPSAVPGWMARATAPRPAVYCNRDTLPAVLATGFRGCLWLAIPGWRPGDPLPAAPGCTIVAVQDNYDNPAYDLSYVLDPTWPAPDPPEETMLATGQFMTEAVPAAPLAIAAPVGADGNVYITAQTAPGGPYLKTGPIGGRVPVPGPVSVRIEVVGNVPYVFVQSDNPVASGVGDVYVSQLAAGAWSAWVKIT